MANAATENFAQDVAAALVCGQDSIRNEKGCGSRMIGDDAQAGIAARFAILIAGTGQFAGSGDQRRKESVSKLESLPCSTAAIRSNPAPVSMEGLGNGR